MLGELLDPFELFRHIFGQLALSDLGYVYGDDLRESGQFLRLGANFREIQLLRLRAKRRLHFDGVFFKFDLSRGFGRGLLEAGRAYKDRGQKKNECGEVFHPYLSSEDFRTYTTPLNG